MTPRTRWETGAWAATAACVLLGAHRWGTAGAARADVRAIPVLAAPDPALGSDSARADTIATAAEYLDEHDPFSRERGGAAAPSAAGPVAPPPGPGMPPGYQPAPVPRPALVLRGVVGVAPDLRAVIDGLPGVEGSALLAPGDTVRGFRVRRVSPDTVVVQGADTTWRLTVRRQW